MLLGERFLGDYLLGTLSYRLSPGKFLLLGEGSQGTKLKLRENGGRRLGQKGELARGVRTGGVLPTAIQKVRVR